jgi:hypothetical protein
MRNRAWSTAIIFGAWVALSAASCGGGGGSGNAEATDAAADSDAGPRYDAHTGPDTGVDTGPDAGAGFDARTDATTAMDAADGGTCPPPTSTPGPTCDACITQNCEAAWCACRGDTDSVDDAGVSGCIRYVGCVERCVASDSGTPTACLQNVCATSDYTTAEQHEGQAFLDCSVQYCSSPCGQ